MQRLDHHKVLGRGRGRAAAKIVCRARVLSGQRTGADAGRWATPQRPAMIEASCFREVPSASNDLTKRSRDTVGSPDSILATRD
jgi:hypothetical protein